jgi:copper chaperone NosL
MKNHQKLPVLIRVLIALCAVSLVFILWTPIWRIELDAPQYPEGLSLKIHANDLKGNVDIINGLNHYIGMKTLHAKDFIEFTVLPYIIIAFSILFFAVALTGSKKMLRILFGLFVLFGIVAMIDFWRWEYNYGHNLNPDAAIVVPGMAYQPPLIGFKQLLNFGAYSVPDIGAWIFIGCGVVLLIALLLGYRHTRMSAKKVIMSITLMSGLFLSACTQGPQPFKIGKDNCSHCKMTIADKRFGAEAISTTGRIFKFDDIACLQSYMKSTEAIIDKIYLVDYANGNELIDAKKALLLKDSKIRCPMHGNLIAFSDEMNLNEVRKSNGGEEVRWEKVQ